MSKVLPNKSSIIGEHQIHPADTGSCFVQVALLTQRVKEISQHLEFHKKDHIARRSLLKMVAQRRRFLEYIKKTFQDMYDPLVAKLEIRVKKHQ